MNKNKTYLITGAAILIALISVVSATSQSSKKRAAEAEVFELQQKITKMEAFVPEPSAEPEIVYLTQEGGTNELTDLKNQLARLQNNEGRRDGDNREAREVRGREGWEDRIARMKEEEPERYAEMVKRREERQQEMRYNLAQRTATFMDLDTTGMSPEELANHEQLVEKMSRVWELSEQFQDPEAAPDREAMREMWEMAREIRPLMDQERTVMFKQLGADIGYEGEDSEAFATHLEDIIDATSQRMPGGRGGPGGGRGGR